MEPKVIHNQEAHRYELWLEDKRIGLADYSLMPGERHFVHTEIDLDQQGKGYAANLMREVLADVRANSKDKVVPVCSYVVMYMKRHPETHDLLKDSIEEAVAACRSPGRSSLWNSKTNSRTVIPMSNKFLLTGARGVLGKRIASILNSIPGHSVFEFPGDITNKQEVVDFFEENGQFTHLIHVAALVPAFLVEANPVRAYEVNVTGTANIVEEYLKKNTLGHVTYVSSSHVYRPSRCRLRESARTGPMNTYGRTKLAGEFASLDLCRQKKVKLCIARVFSLYSDDQSAGFLLPSLQSKIMDSGNNPAITIPGWNNVRDFSSADFHAKAIVHLANLSVDGVYNVGSGKGKTVLEFAKERFSFKLKSKWSSRAKPRNHLIANVSKLRSSGLKID
jgi:nucleoside-diphosphate-sugar epimerase/predicted GNAT family acetyltransferase